MRLKRLGTLALTMLMLVVLTACSAISEGYITAKEFEPEHTSYILQCHLIGKITVCNTVPIHYSDKWRFDIQKGDDSGYVYVTEEEYNSYEVGDYYAAK